VKESKRYLWVFVATLVGLPLIYIASFGPACKLCEDERMSPRTCWMNYRPLTWLVVHRPPLLGEPLQAYARRWGEWGRIDGSMGRYNYSHSRSPIDCERDVAQGPVRTI